MYLLILLTEPEEEAPKEPKRARLDSEVNIFDQMTSVFDEIVTPAPPSGTKTDTAPAEAIRVDGDVTIVHITDRDSSEEMKVHVMSCVMITP